MEWIIANWRLVLITILFGGIIALVSEVNHYRNSAIDWKGKSLQASSLADTRLKTINQMQIQQKAVSAIDQSYQLQLKAKDDEISSLSDRVKSGSVGLRVKAVCPSGVPQASAASGITNAASAELSADARQDYYALRSQLAQATAQINGLQAYIREITK
ncbi:prophage endopeptidase [Rosenbergiella nectarea]|uniref:Prophage endopeptidase n=1 Tax=Rosenbergiella nectarea TaxID=988801 RepID=A0A1H9MZI8_9GAMM|nr:lysis protein [Rosenbergiella nectarea]SER28825.1 prophage endopeptidase [Rosenbergiella nectarea]